jgi:preprotein translocase subunit SecF
MSNNQTSGFSFLKYAPIFSGISAVLVFVFLIYLSLRSLPYGIDFLGGTEIQVHFQKEVALESFRSAVQKSFAGEVSLQQFGSAQDYLLRFQESSSRDNQDVKAQAASSAVVERVKKLLQEDPSLAQAGGEIVRMDSVGPQVGSELKRAGALSVFYSLLIILIYIAMRFDYKYAPGAVICLVHDVVITLGLFVLMGKTIQLPVIAAFLTLIGYSLNDTIVVFDRIREMVEKNTKLSFKQAVDVALNQMWQRTVVTSGTTLAVALALALLTHGDISDIAWIMTIGIVVGTYSSIYIASPLTAWLDQYLAGKDIRILPKPKFSEGHVS